MKMNVEKGDKVGLDCLVDLLIAHLNLSVSFVKLTY